MKKKLWIVGLLLVLVVVGTVSCATSGDERVVYSEGTGSGRVTATTTATTTVASMPSPGVEYDSYKGVDYGYTEEAALDYTERMIIRSGTFSIVVEDVNTAVRTLSQFADTYDGWVVSSNNWQDGERTYGTISFRVDASRFEEAMAAVRALADEVRSETTSGQDVTEEYTDLNAQLITLQASAEQLLALMDRAGTVEEILDVQKQLTSTNTQIEQVKGRMQYLEQSSATSLITVTLEQSKLGVEFSANTRTVKEGNTIYFNADVSGGFTPYSYSWDFGDGETSTEANPQHTYKDDGTYTVTLTVTDDRGNVDGDTREDYITVTPGWDAGGVADSAVNGLVGFGRALANIFIWLGIFSPVWIVIGVIIFFAVRRRRKGKPRD